MLTRILFCFFYIMIYQISLAQVGHTTFTFNDPTRTGGFGSGGGSGRQIQTEIYYPAATTGDNVAITPGTYPVIVFGHGFVMSWDAYANIWQHYTALGYVLAFPRTEGGITPNHGEFGQDLKLIAANILQLNSNVGSLLFGNLSPNTAIVGHSMGGGATVLAGINNTAVKAIACLAPAETNPSAISAAALVSAPSLIISGSGDGVTPPADHHIPIHNALANSCKSFSSITGGGHCYFANSNTNCDFGELMSIFSVTLTRVQQQAKTFSILDPFLAYHLKGDCAANIQFLNSMNTSPTGFVNQTNCQQNPTPTISLNNQLLSTPTVGVSYQWILNGSEILGANNANFAFSQNGNYQVEVTFADGCPMLSANFTVNNASIENQELVNFSIFPNPSNGKFIIRNESNLTLEVNVFSAQGSKIAELKTNSMIDLSQFEDGIYFVELEKRVYRLVKE